MAYNKYSIYEKDDDGDSKYLLSVTASWEWWKPNTSKEVLNITPKLQTEILK